MTIPTRTYTYIANTLAQSNQANVNENTLYAWANGGIDDTNLNHLVGIYASSITGTTAAQCTFGTNPAASAGYKFVAPAANLTPLTISGVPSQSADIFDVTLTSGGTKTLGVDSIGAVFTRANSAASAVSGDLTVAQSASQGVLWFGNGTTSQSSEIVGSVNVISLFPQSSGSNKFAVSTTNANALGIILTATNGAYSAPTTSAGDGVFQRSSTTGLIYMGGAGTNGSIDWSVTSANVISLRQNNSSGYAPVNGGAYTNSSDASLKNNVAPLASGTAEILALNPVSFTWKNLPPTPPPDGAAPEQFAAHAAMTASIAAQPEAPGLGFIAQDVAAVLPDLVSTDNYGLMGVNYDGIIPVLVKHCQEEVAVRQQMQALLKAAGIAGF